jgi:tripartite ATP-independent transporter DctP family solute receptor
MSRLDRRTLLKAGGLALAAPLGAAPLVGAPSIARAQTRAVTVASLFGEDKPETQVWLRVRERLATLVPGRFDLRIVQNAALGGEREVAEGLRLGSVQASLSTVSALSSWVPESQILDLPFVFADAAHVRRALDGPQGDRLKGLFEAQGFLVPAFINYGARHLLAKEPIVRPDQLRGKRIRVIQSPLHTELWRAFGALPTPIPIPETYNALKSGVVDCMDLTKSAYAGFRLHEVVPYLTETAHIWATGVLVLSAGFWRTLGTEERAAFAAATREAAPHFDALMVADEATSMAKVAAEGGKVVQPADRAAWQAGAQGVWSSLAPRVGGQPRIDALRAA